MSSQITSKLEVNLINTNTSTQYAAEFAIKNKVPAIVASPEYIAPLIAHRAVMGGGYKIICALDFPKGKNFAMDKLFRANPDFVAADGFDILLSTGRTEVESKNEMKSIYEYLKANRPMCNIRWCLNMFVDEVEGTLKNMKNYPPTLVRVSPHLNIPNVGIDEFKDCVKTIGSHIPHPIKLSGNIDLKVIEAFSDARQVKRFDVTMEQADTIVRSLKVNNQVPTEDSSKPTPKGPAVKKTGPRIYL